jgi:hypothetical protein
MIKTTTVAPPHSLILVTDSAGFHSVPETMGGALVVSTGSCIAVGCQSEVDGDTELTVGGPEAVEHRGTLAFRGELETPSHNVSVKTVLGETVLEVPTERDRTQVCVWVNHTSEPDKIFIGLE